MSATITITDASPALLRALADALDVCKTAPKYSDPVPATPTGPRTRDDWVTPERVMLAQQMAAAGKRWTAIATGLMALPGLPVTGPDVKRYAKRTGIHRALSDAALAHQAIMGERMREWQRKRRLGAATVAPEPPPGPAHPPAPPAIVRPPVGRMDTIRQVAGAVGAKATPIRLDAMQLLDWAGKRGLSLHLPISDADVAACNAKARAVGHPPIEYAPPSREVRA